MKYGFTQGQFLSYSDIENLTKALKMGLDFKVDKSKSVVHFKEQEDIMTSLIEPLPKKSLDLDKVLNECKEKIIDGSVNFSSPNFMAFPDCGNSTAAMCGHIISGMLNQNLINSIHTSPTATFVEMTVINWLREILGYEVTKNPKTSLDVGGINVPGGTMANTSAVLLARERARPSSMEGGMYKSEKLKMFIPKGIGHYTSKAAMSWLGLGKDNIIEVETTNEFKIDKKDLINKIKECKKVGDIPFILIAYAGDSRTMAIDDFAELSEIAKEGNIWFHIDACHGASLCFSDKLKSRLGRIELADSITIDPHKVLFVPYPCSYLLVKNPADLKPISGVSDLITKEKYSFGQITPFLGSRAFDSLKVWFLIKNLGKERIGELIEKRHELARYFEDELKKQEGFYLLNKVIINSSVFIYIPKESKEKLELNIDDQETIILINELNLRIQKKMFKQGKFYVHTFKIDDFMNKIGAGREKNFQVQRLMIGNPLTTEKDITELIECLKKTAMEEWKILSHEKSIHRN
ncbi:MAG: pyridoxal-dependent decarboxylase [archaeon]